MPAPKKELPNATITLSGFRELDEGEKSAAQKILDHFERRYRELCDDDFALKVHMKRVHAREKSEKHEIMASLRCAGRHFEADVVERNLFVGLDLVLKKIENEISK